MRTTWDGPFSRRRVIEPAGFGGRMWRYFTGQAVSDAEAEEHYQRGRRDERAEHRCPMNAVESRGVTAELEDES